MLIGSLRIPKRNAIKTCQFTHFDPLDLSDRVILLTI